MGNSALLAQPKVEKETEGATNGTISWGACSMQGWRRSMEDAHAGVLDMAVGSSAGQGGVHFFAVYDGHGGSEVATYCGRHLHSELLQHDEFKEGGDVGRAIGETFIEMDRKIVGAVAKKEMLDLDESSDSFSSEARPGDAPVTATPPRPAALDLADVARTAAASASEADEDSASWEPHSGCTAVAAVVWGQRVIVANAGDSRCVVCDSNGKAIPLSFDHKPEDEREQARIYAAGAVVEMGRVSSRHTSSALNLTRAIGDLDLCASIPANYDDKKNPDKGPKEQAITAWPDIKTLELNSSTEQEPHEFMILACDGIWDCLENQEAIDFVRERLPKQNDAKGGESSAGAGGAGGDGAVSVSLLSEIGAEMCDHCLADDIEGDCLGTDNMTVMIILLRGASTNAAEASGGGGGGGGAAAAAGARRGAEHEGAGEGASPHQDKKRRVSGE